jgi:anti-anti-sigma factor
MLKIENISTKNSPDISTKEQEIFHVTLEGRLDGISAGDAKDTIAEVYKDKSHFILLLDLEKLVFISTMGLRTVFLITREVKAKGSKLVLINVPELIGQAFEIAGLLPGIGSNPAFETSSEADAYLEKLESGIKPAELGVDAKTKTIVLTA